MAADSGTRTSRLQYAAVRGLPGSPSTRVRPRAARRPEASVTATSSSVPELLGGTITRRARDPVPARETGRAERTSTRFPRPVHFIATASRPGSGDASQ
ncbi:hypothetical protein STANM309S_00846 [Streptomyces tanashiensis]